MVIKTDENGRTSGYQFECPVCGKEWGHYFYNITEQGKILCDDCLINDTVDINLRMKTLIWYVLGLKDSVEDIGYVTNCLRPIG